MISTRSINDYWCSRNQFEARAELKRNPRICQINYGVNFLITEKVDVKGNNQHPPIG